MRCFRPPGSEGAAAVDGQYMPTAKNVLVKELYPQLGFTALLERKETQTENRIETFGYDLQHAGCPQSVYSRENKLGSFAENLGRVRACTHQYGFAAKSGACKHAPYEFRSLPQQKQIRF